MKYKRFTQVFSIEGVAFSGSSTWDMKFLKSLNSLVANTYSAELTHLIISVISALQFLLDSSICPVCQDNVRILLQLLEILRTFLHNSVCCNHSKHYHLVDKDCSSCFGLTAEC